MINKDDFLLEKKYKFTVTKSGNLKLGHMYSFNLPAIVTCAKNVPCSEVCYATRGRYVFDNVKKCYWNNLKAWKYSPRLAVEDILAQIKPNKAGLCRIHASGDIPDFQYLTALFGIAYIRPQIKFMLFTKKYDLVNSWLEQFRYLPDNLTVVFSAWDGFPMYNPNNLPVAYVSRETTTCPNQKDKTVTCSKCLKCWNLKAGEEVIFKMH